MLSVRAIAACLALVTGIGAYDVRHVQIGYCAMLREIDAIKAAGFDYVELRTSEIAALSDEEFEDLAQKLKRIALPVPPFFNSLRRIRYQGRISIEARAVDFAGQAPQSIAFLRALSQ